MLLVGLYAQSAAAAPIKVACAGEHTTHSDIYPSARETQPVGMQEYPRMLQDLMGAGYDVRNFGDCCASIVQGYPSSETHPYISGGNYKNSVSFAPDVVVIGSWGRHDWGLSCKTACSTFTVAKFQTDYETLVKAYLALKPAPKVYCSTPIPILNGADGPDNGLKTSPVSDVIRAVATKYNLPIIDLYSAFLGHPEFYRQKPLNDAEGEHASDAGMHKMAELVHAALTGDTTGSGGSGAGGGASTAGAAGSTAAGNSGSSVGGSANTSGGDTSATGGAGVAGAPVVSGTAGASATSAGGSTEVGIAGAAVIASGGAAASDPTQAADGCSCSLASRETSGLPWGGIGLVGFGSALLLRRRRSDTAH
jgi:MYXO-CTERM domain-containing protein